ncbi:MAG: hypothetical protein R2751_02320 [Bacteroidales bacterium]
MPRPVQDAGIFLLFAVLLFASCRRDPLEVSVGGIRADVPLERFDSRLLAIAPDSLDQSVGSLYREFGDFFDVFNVHVIRIGPASTRNYSSYLSMFLNDPLNREVFAYADSVFSRVPGVQEGLNDGFRHYAYHYPDSVLPRVIAYVSGFNQGLFTVGRTVGVGLDQYLGADCPFYRELGTPEYLLHNKTPERLPVDAMLAWGTQLYPYNDSVDHVLNRMIHQGMLWYFVEAMYPGLSDEELLGFTPEQMRWCTNNEKHMWTHLVEDKLLFSSDPLAIRKLIEEAPHTSYFTPESPGRAAVWQGLQIVREYARRNPGMSLDRILSQREYSEILRGSRYNP